MALHALHYDPNALHYDPKTGRLTREPHRELIQEPDEDDDDRVPPEDLNDYFDFTE